MAVCEERSLFYLNIKNHSSNCMNWKMKSMVKSCFDILKTRYRSANPHGVDTAAKEGPCYFFKTSGCLMKPITTDDMPLPAYCGVADIKLLTGNQLRGIEKILQNFGCDAMTSFSIASYS